MNKVKIKKPYGSVIVFVLVIILIRITGWFTDFPDRFFPALNKFFAKTLYSFSSRVDFSAGDIFYTLIAVTGIAFIVRFVNSIILKNKLRILNMVSVLFYFLTFIYGAFHFLWGFNYYKTPLKESYNTENIKLEELKNLAGSYLEKSIEYRNKVGEDEDGVFISGLIQEQIDSLIAESAGKLRENYRELKFTSNLKPNMKKSLYSTMFSYLGVLGYYNPFTNEGQYNARMPPTKMLFTQMHETAHQWGFAPENEANFIGFLIGSQSNCIDFLYVSHYMALRQILNRIVWEDPVFVEQFLEKYSAGMKRDRAYEIQVQVKYHHTADDAFSMLNEAYLRLNNQDGLESYGKFVELLVGYNRKYSIN